MSAPVRTFAALLLGGWYISVHPRRSKRGVGTFVHGCGRERLSPKKLNRHSGQEAERVHPASWHISGRDSVQFHLIPLQYNAQAKGRAEAPRWSRCLPRRGQASRSAIRRWLPVAAVQRRPSRQARTSALAGALPRRPLSLKGRKSAIQKGRSHAEFAPQ